MKPNTPDEQSGSAASFVTPLVELAKTAPLDFLLGLGVALLPIFHLTVKSWTNGWLAFLTVVSLMVLIHEIRNGNGLFEDWKTKAVFACLAAPLLGIGIAQLARKQLFWNALDGPSRMACAAVVFLALKKRRIPFVGAFRWCCSLSILVCLFSILAFKTGIHAWGGRFATYFVDCDTFGQHVTLLTFLSFMMVQMDETPRAVQLALDCAAVLGGAYLVLGSQTRGAWIAVGPLSIVWLLAVRRAPLRILMTSLAGVFALLIVLTLKHESYNRVLSIYQELSQWFSGHNRETSAGIRITMWNMSWALFQNSPAFGYGEYEDYKYLLDNTWIASVSTDQAKEAIRHGPHNQVAAEALRSGFLGILYSIGYFAIPAIVFLRGLFSASRRLQKSAALGFCVVVAFAVFSLSMEVFSLKFAASFFGFLIAAFSAECLTQSGKVQTPLQT